MNDFQRRFGHREREVISADVLATLAAFRFLAGWFL